MIGTYLAMGLIGLVAQPDESKTRPPACQPARPTIGRLVVGRSGVSLTRGDAHYQLQTPGEIDLCAHDQLKLIGGSAAMQIDKVTTTLEAGRSYTLTPYAKTPAWLQLVASMLKNGWSPLAAASRTATSAAQGEEQLFEWRVAGLDDGRAKLAAGERSIQLTFAGLAQAKAVLIGPNGRQLAGQLVPTGRSQAPRFTFPKTRFSTGERWSIRLEGGGTILNGSFSIVDGPLVLPIFPEPLGGQDGRALRAMTLAGSDPDQWSLEALQHVLDPGGVRLPSEDAEIMLAAWYIDPLTRPHRPQP